MITQLKFTKYAGKTDHDCRKSGVAIIIIEKFYFQCRQWLRVEFKKWGIFYKVPSFAPWYKIYWSDHENKHIRKCVQNTETHYASGYTLYLIKYYLTRVTLVLWFHDEKPSIKFNEELKSSETHEHEEKNYFFRPKPEVFSNDLMLRGKPADA